MKNTAMPAEPAMSSAILEKLRATDFPKKDISIAEAQFGFRYVNDYLGELPANGKVLEVGCGSGILMGLLKERYPGLNIEGVEPLGDGFAALGSINQYIRDQGIQIQKIGYEQLEPQHRYDLIYSINVFEHLDDWRDFLRFVEPHLTPTGVCLILCPNYGFPYESHFKIPVIFNKPITASVFRKTIVRQEERKESHGLWRSLNFVKLQQVRKALAQTSLRLTVRHRIIEDMIVRIGNDAEFRKRQKVIGTLGKVAYKTGVTKLFRYQLFQNVMPYMQLELRSDSTRQTTSGT
ncbi:class I SAM-dependent methyltransferase [Roseobacter litoralis]|uniref:class I SAM-dependent methyltransferase n=1 Tax=Roseobacter litoralis TaxID=42443 RepID=UPI0024930D58|nr:class I SAM-dependent methyltransferase [Roseobacter litoralis]